MIALGSSYGLQQAEASTATSSCLDASSHGPILSHIPISPPIRHRADEMVMASFSWSDFPVMVEHEPLPSRRAPPPPMQDLPYIDFSSSPRHTTHTRKRQTPNPSEQHNRPHRSDHTGTPTKTTSTKKVVRFAPTLAVRTFSLVLGDHPWCEDGLALELGWDYSDDQRDEPSFPASRSTGGGWGTPSGTTPVRTRPYLERKRLLLEVGGLSATDLDRMALDQRDSDSDHHSLAANSGMARVDSITSSLSSFAEA